MSRHYTSSKIVNWLRKKIFNLDKPTSLPWGKWDEWEENTKANRPVAFFFTESLPNAIEWIPAHSIDYLDKLRIYLVNRMNHSHGLISSLEKGKYHEFENRLLYGMFDSYVEFIEVEEANMHVVFADSEQKKYKRPWWYEFRILRWCKSWRCPEAAIDHLKWEMSLSDKDINDPMAGIDNHQAIAAREKMALYTWWKHIRPSRGEAWAESGFKAFWSDMDTKYGGNWVGLGGTSKLTVEEEAKYNELSSAQDALEEQWADEDDQMMVRLIKIRRNLWT